MLLNELAKKYNTDKKIDDNIKCRNGVMGHNYVIVYDELLNNKKIKNLLEIGVSFGGSLRMWDEYFKNKTNIIGIDINENRFKKNQLENNRIIIKIGDQSDKKFLKTLGDKKYDLIIDDGSHKTEHHLISFEILFDFLNSGGMYVIEDLHVANKTIEHFTKIKNNLSNTTSEIENIKFYLDNKLCVITKK